ncbi:hypothetical protein ScPMuIL_008429 [Solemya velum]
MKIHLLGPVLLICWISTLTRGQETCIEGYFQCNNGQCIDIPISKKCDTRNDCSDGTDELNCDFEPPAIDILNVVGKETFDVYFTSAPYAKAVEIQCHAKGSPIPEYEWRVNGAKVYNRVDVIESDSVTGTLTLYNPSQLDNTRWGPYQCLAKNSVGTAMSDIIQVRKAYLGSFPSNEKYAQRVKAGEYLKLECKSNPPSYPPAVYSWHRQKPGTTEKKTQQTDKRITVDANGDLHFLYVKSSDKSSPDVYLCSMYNSEIQSQMYGSETTLTVDDGSVVPSKPVVQFHGKVTAMLGTEATLQCIFSGFPEPDVKWYSLTSLEIYNDEKYSFTDYTKKLIIKNVEESDEGQYACVGTNSLGTTEKIAVTLDVIGPPIWLERLQSQIVPVGSDVIFTCKARNLHGDVELEPPQWFRNGDRLSDLMWNKIELSRDKTELKVLDVHKPNDIMSIQCQYKNQHGIAFADASLNVKNAIRITDKTPVLMVDDKQTAYIKLDEVKTLFIVAEIDESVTLQYEWFFKNRTILTRDSNTYTLGPDGRNLTIDSRSIDNLNDILGEYTVKVYYDYETKYDTLTLTQEGFVEPAPVAAAGGGLWWIGIVMAVLVVLVLIILIVCCLYRNRGGSWPVDRKERAAGHDPEKELADSGFHDLARADDDDDDDYFKKPKADNVSLPSDKPIESDDEDSMLEYGGEMDTSKFNEEGSFIGIYGEKKGKSAPQAPTQSTV